MVPELGIKQDVVCVKYDSKSAINLSRNQMYHEGTKHIDVRLHFITDIIEEGAIEVVKVYINDNPATMLTKLVPLRKFKHCPDLLNVDVD